MKSQALTIDLTGKMGGLYDTRDCLHRRIEMGDVLVQSTEPEYPGMEKIKGRVIWDRLYALDDPDRPVQIDEIHDLVRKFAQATGTKLVGTNHVGMITYLDFKAVELTNVTDMEWVHLTLEKENA